MGKVPVGLNRAVEISPHNRGTFDHRLSSVCFQHCRKNSLTGHHLQRYLCVKGILTYDISLCLFRIPSKGTCISQRQTHPNVMKPHTKAAPTSSIATRRWKRLLYFEHQALFASESLNKFKIFCDKIPHKHNCVSRSNPTCGSRKMWLKHRLAHTEHFGSDILTTALPNPGLTISGCPETSKRLSELYPVCI